MAHAHEYKCGCIIHSLAGTLRKCKGQVSRSLSGRMRPSEDGAAQAHGRAMNDTPHATYELADILP